MTHEEINWLIRVRIEKLSELRKSRVNPFSNSFKTTHTITEVRSCAEDKTAEELEKIENEYAVAGRIMAINNFGKALFLRIRDFTGQIQVFLKKDLLGEDTFQIIKWIDIGDFIGVKGRLFITKTGELTLLASVFHFLTKSIRPLPEKWHGLKDIETRYRQRYVDLVMNQETKKIFITRAEIIKYIRNFLDARGFLEVETPMLHPVLGGANARPFKTHHNLFDMELYLRIAPELYHKRLVVGGFERVFEINKNFRNEGMSAWHNPEFTMIEFYQAYATYEDLMALTEELLSGLVLKIKGSYKLQRGGNIIDFTPPFRRMTIMEALKIYAGASDSDFNDFASARAFAKRLGLTDEQLKFPLHDDERNNILQICMILFEEIVEKYLIQPTFIVDYPLIVSPLSRKKDCDPYLVERFELYIDGCEVANAFSELNDPFDQKERFLAQLKAKEAGDLEAMEFDEDYIRALEYGMPPTAGEGIGIDRLTMLITDQSNIREVILFPLLRPE